MVQTVGVQGGLTPDVSGGLNVLLQTFGTKQSRAKETQERKKQEDLQREIDIVSGGITGGNGKRQQAALARIAAINPQMANSIRQTLERGDQLELQDVAQKTDEGTRQALLIQKQPDFASKQNALIQLGQQAVAKGEDPTRILELSNMSEPQLELELQKMVIQGTDIKSLTDAALTPVTQAPGTTVGKINQDIETGQITQEQGNRLLAQELKDPDSFAAFRNELVKDRLRIEQEQELRRNDPQEQLALQQLQLNLEAKRASVRANKETLKRSNNLKTDVKRLVGELLGNKDGVTSFVGPIDQLTGGFALGPKTLEAKTKINQLKSILTADNLNLMTGVLSETDIKILSDIAGGGLDVSGDEDIFITELERMQQSFNDVTPTTQKTIQVDF